MNTFPRIENFSAPFYRAQKQQGITLITMLIMLTVFMLFVVTAVNMTNTNLKIAGNTQFKNEAKSAAQYGIEEVISTDFTTRSNTTIVPVDINGDNHPDYQTQVAAPTCIKMMAIKNLELDTSDSNDLSCFVSGAGQNTGIVEGTNLAGNSLCVRRIWDIRADVTDPVSGTAVTVHQGIAMPEAVGAACQ